MDPDEVHAIVTELFARGVIYCESVPNSEWNRRKWPLNAGFFRLIDAHLKLLREAEKYHDLKGQFSYKLTRG